MQANFHTGKIIINESSKNLRRRGRKALSGNWFKAFLTVIIAVVLITVPAMMIDELFGISINLGERLRNSYSSMGSSIDQDVLEYFDTLTVKTSPASGLYALFVAGAITFGLAVYFMKLYRKKNPKISDVISGFEFYLKSTALFFYMLIFIALWFMVPIVGTVLGVIAIIRYSQSFYILIDNPSYTVRQCVNESKYLMSGNKMSYFIMHLSFLGWLLLATIPIIILSVFLASTFDVTKSNIFMSIILLTVGGIAAYCVQAYIYSTQIAFYEILTGKEEADVYSPGEY